MADALCFFLIFTYQIWRLGKFRQKVVHVVDLTYGFHQEDESRQCQVVRHSALDFVDGGQSLNRVSINLTISGVEYS